MNPEDDRDDDGLATSPHRPGAHTTFIDEELAAGSPAGDYVIQGKLGSGTFGTVYWGLHPLIEKRVAVKVLRRWCTRQPEFVERFIQEARAVNRIRHRKIVDVFGFGTLEDGRHYQVMELLEGVSLADRIRQSRHIPTTEVLVILRDLAEALDAAHASNIVHRDLKPANVFLCRDSDGSRFTKLLDFGIAKLLDDEEPQKDRSEGVLGTPYFMAPEQCTADAVTAATDVYAFGVLTYSLLTSEHPYSGTPDQVMDKHVHAVPRRPSLIAPSIPPRVDDLVLGMLEKEPQLRPLRLRLVVTELEQTLGLAASVPPELVERNPSGTSRMPRRPSSIALPAVHPFGPQLASSTAPFIGRQSELDALFRLVREGRRLVTLLGPGGMGKTRTAIELAQRLKQERIPPLMVDLSMTTGLDEIYGRLADAIGMPTQGEGVDMFQSVMDSLSARGPCLMVLDGVEHLLADVAPMVRTLLVAAPALSIVATSRAPLRVSGEVVYELSFLQEAAALFLSRARDVVTDYAPSPDDLAAIDVLCRRLDGIPLALELAAARVRVLSPRQLLERLDRSLDVLGMRTGPARQSTMSDTVAWSWDLLEDVEKRGLAWLSVFSGDFSLAAAEHVVLPVSQEAGWDPTTLVSSLREQSLLGSSTTDRGERFRLYNVVRTYAVERISLAELRTATLRHAGYFVEHGKRLLASNDFEEVETLRMQLRRVRGDLQRILRRGLDEDAEVIDLENGLWMSAILDRLAPGDGIRAEERPWLEALLQRVRGARDVASDTEALGLVALATRQYIESSLKQAKETSLAALSLVKGQFEIEAMVKEQQARIELGLQALDEALLHCQAAHQGYQRAHRPLAQGATFVLQAAILGSLGRLEDSLAVYERGRTHARVHHDRRTELGVLAGAAFSYFQRGDIEHARNLYIEARGLSETLQARRMAYLSSGYLGLVEFEAQQIAEARRSLRTAIREARAWGDRRAYALFLAVESAVLATQDNVQHSARGFQKSWQLLDNRSYLVDLVRIYAGHLDLARAREAERQGHSGRASNHLEHAAARVEWAQARMLGEHRLLDRSDDARVAVRRLDAAVRTHET